VQGDIAPGYAPGEVAHAAGVFHGGFAFLDAESAVADAMGGVEFGVLEDVVVAVEEASDEGGTFGSTNSDGDRGVEVFEERSIVGAGRRRRNWRHACAVPDMFCGTKVVALPRHNEPSSNTSCSTSRQASARLQMMHPTNIGRKPKSVAMRYLQVHQVPRLSFALMPSEESGGAECIVCWGQLTANSPVHGYGARKSTLKRAGETIPLVGCEGDRHRIKMDTSESRRSVWWPLLLCWLAMCV